MNLPSANFSKFILQTRAFGARPPIYYRTACSLHLRCGSGLLRCDRLRLFDRRMSRDRQHATKMSRIMQRSMLNNDTHGEIITKEWWQRNGKDCQTHTRSTKPTMDGYIYIVTFNVTLSAPATQQTVTTCYDMNKCEWLWQMLKSQQWIAFSNAGRMGINFMSFEFDHTWMNE